MWRYLLVFVLCAIGGGLLGRTASSAGTPRSNAEAESTPPPRREAPAKWRKADFQKAAEDYMSSIKDRSYDPYRGIWDDWTDAEIRAALDQGLIHPECLTTTGSGMSVMNSLIKELLKRDTDAVVAWFDSIAFDAARQRFIYMISYVWPEDRAAAGLDFLLNHRSMFRTTSGWSILAKSLQSAASQGPAGVEAMLTKFKQEGFDLEFENPINFPAGFDFKGLLEGQVWQEMEPGGVRESMVRAFRRQDPEQAFSWLMEKQGAAGLGLTGWFGPEDPGNERLTWLGKKIEVLDAGQQAEFFKSTMGEWVRLPDASLISFARDLRTPATRGLIREAAVQQIYAGNARGSLTALEALGEPEERLRALDEATPGELFARGHRPMSPADEAFIRGTLAGWNADEGRVQAIVDQLKK